jgi:hypothetical protein
MLERKCSTIDKKDFNMQRKGVVAISDKVWRCYKQRIIKIISVIFVLWVLHSFYVPQSLSLNGINDLFHFKRIVKEDFITIEFMKPKGEFWVMYGDARTAHWVTAIDTNKSKMSADEFARWTRKKIYTVYGDDNEEKIKFWLPWQ